MFLRVDLVSENWNPTTFLGFRGFWGDFRRWKYTEI